VLVGGILVYRIRQLIHTRKETALSPGETVFVVKYRK
jgi:hypothetical protein